jgi:hypothetical protein
MFLWILTLGLSVGPLSRLLQEVICLVIVANLGIRSNYVTLIPNTDSYLYQDFSLNNSQVSILLIYILIRINETVT